VTETNLVQIALNNELCQKATYVRKFKFEEVNCTNWDDIYSKWIKTIPKGHGVYIFSTKDKVIYIGLSGKVRKWPISPVWDIKKRLKASRGIDGSGTDISTVNFIKQIVTTGRTDIKRYNEINVGVLKEFHITVLFTESKVPPSYLEAFLLYEYLKKNDELPRFNLSF
jgi:hypothetical protein